MLSPSFVLVSGVKETVLRLTVGLVCEIGAVDEVESSNRGGVVLLLFVDELDFTEEVFTLFVGFAGEIEVLSGKDFLFLPFGISTSLISADFKSSSDVGSSLAYLSFNPSFFHAGMCFSTASDREGIS